MEYRRRRYEGNVGATPVLHTLEPPSASHNQPMHYTAPMWTKPKLNSTLQNLQDFRSQSAGYTKPNILFIP